MSRRKYRKRNYNYITILRGIATIGVTAFHLASWKFPGGFLGVIMFFVMSGFLMMRNLDHKEELDTYQKAGSLIKARIKKLLPPLYSVIIIGLIFSLFYSKSVFGDSILSSLPVALGYQNIYQILAGGSYFKRNGNFNMFTHLWYISLQIQFIIIFYLVNYLIDRYGKRDKKSKIFLLISLISFAISYFWAAKKANITRIYYGPDTRMSAIFMGALFYLLSKKIDKIDKFLDQGQEKIAIYVLLALAVIPFFFIKGEAYSTYKLFNIFYTLFIALLVSFLYLYERNLVFVRKEKTNIGAFGSILFYLGSRSYHIYLWQYTIQILFTYKLATSTENKALFIILQLLIVIILSEFSYNIFNRKIKTRIFIPISILIMSSLVFASNFIENPKEKDIKELEAKINKNKAQIEEDNKKALMGKNKDQDQIESTGSLTLDSNSKEAIEHIKEKNEDQSKTKIEKKDPYDFNFNQNELDYLKSLSVTAVGDSVLININSYLRDYIPNLYLDGEVGRDMINGPDVLSGIKNNQGLGDIIIIALGSNGSMEADDMQQIMDIAEGREVFFVNTSHTQSWQDYVNNQIKEFCDKTEGAYLVDRYSFAKPKSDQIFAEDKVHPNVEGSEDYARIICREILNANDKSSN